MRILWLALLLGSEVWAGQQYFRQSNATTWDEARLHCQACFKDLTTLTCWNIQDIAKNLSSDFWVGLRSSLNGPIPWSRWSNGDPVTYQNWYPGHPVPKVETCPLTPNNTSNSTMEQKMNNTEEQCPLVMEILTCLNLTLNELKNISGPLVNPTPPISYSTPLPTVNITSNKTQTCDHKAEKYIEDSCVALLSFGMWKEKQCNESLPFICYDDTFFGEIKVSNVTKSEGFVEWSSGPGNISHYVVYFYDVVKVTENTTINNSTTVELCKRLENLTAGTLYNVQVYPVKCGRDLNPQNISFYTSPSDVYDLSATNVSTTSMELIWSHLGNCDFYLIEGTHKPHEIKENKIVIQNLTPGTKYDFTVSAVVNKTTKSVSATYSNFTLPSRVQNLTSADTFQTDITANWSESEGLHSSYRICLYETSECISCGQCENCYNTTVTNFTFKNKASGKKYSLCVAALTNNDTISGEMVTIEAYTRPKNVELGNLVANDQHIFANWTINGSYKEFRVSIEAAGLKETNDITKTTDYNFTGLKAGVEYTVTVTTLSEKHGLESEPVQKSIHTKPTRPPWAIAAVLNQTSIALTWGVPSKSEGASNIKYNVTCHSVYWKTTTVYQTYENITFVGLNSGTTYTFKVTVVAGNLSSDPAPAFAETKPNTQTLRFAMLCSSQIALYCNNSTVQDNTLEELKKYFGGNLTGINWNLKMVDRR